MTATMAKIQSEPNFSTIPDESLKEYLSSDFDYKKDKKLSNGLRRMRWINHVRKHNPGLKKVGKVEEEKKPPKNHYFDNAKVEKLLQQYVAGACTDVVLRDEIMESAGELIRQIIRAHGLHNIYPGREDSSFGDLFQLAFVQIESVLYKYQKGKAKVFNMMCVKPDSLVMTADGLKKIGNCLPDDVVGEIKPGFLKVFGRDGFNDVSAFLRRPETKTLQITTSQNYKIEVSPEHRMLTSSDPDRSEEVWKEAGDLTIGTCLAIQDAGLSKRVQVKEPQHIRWLPIQDIKESRSETVDITVPQSHSYCANGFVVHNSQIARTVILAHIKKEGRDKKNCKSYQDVLVRRHGTTTRSMMFERFLEEGREICKYNEDHLVILEALGRLFDSDLKPYDGLVAKLVQESGKSRQQVLGFIGMLRMRSFEFTDSPLNSRPTPHPLIYQASPSDEE